MADDAELRRRKARGDNAKRILDDELVQEAFERIERTIYEEWKASAPDAERARHDMYLMHQLFGDFREFFAAVLKKGNDAEKELIRKREANQSPKE